MKKKERKKESLSSSSSSSLILTLSRHFSNLFPPPLMYNIHRKGNRKRKISCQSQSLLPRNKRPFFPVGPSSSPPNSHSWRAEQRFQYCLMMITNTSQISLLPPGELSTGGEARSPWLRQGREVKRQQRGDKQTSKTNFFHGGKINYEFPLPRTEEAKEKSLAFFLPALPPLPLARGTFPRWLGVGVGWREGGGVEGGMCWEPSRCLSFVDGVFMELTQGSVSSVKFLCVWFFPLVLSLPWYRLRVWLGVKNQSLTSFSSFLCGINARRR